MILRYVLAWFPMVLLAIANGVIRVSTYGKYMSELRAHQLSTVTGILLFALYIWALTRWWRLESAHQALVIGGLWLALTVAFEFGFGHYVMGHPWSRLLHDYDLLAGRVWVIGLAWVAVAPWFFYRLQR
jgi:hypothetical protein